MKKYRFPALTYIFLVLFAVETGAVDVSEETYGDFSDYLEEIYGIDQNAGLTAFPVLNVPLGGRSEGMAGAFTAVADDISFLDWNPAGSSMLEKTELAFFHNNWIGDTKVEGAAFASRYKDLGFAAGGKWLYTPFTEYNIYGERVSKGYYSEAVAVLNASYNFLSGYYFSGVSLGVNIKGAFRLFPDYSDADDTDNKDGGLVAGSGQSQSAAMAMVDLGALTRFNVLKGYRSREKNASFALAVRNLGPPVMGESLPTVAVAALSYKPMRPLLFSFDFSFPLNLTDLSLSEKPYWSAGTSVQITPFLSIRAGLLSKTGNVRISLGSAIDLDRISLDVNYTLDLLTQFTPLNRVSLGVRFNLGDQGRGALEGQIDRLYLQGLAAYAQGDAANARSCWEEALRLDSRFEPAKEGLLLIEEGRKLEDRINDMQYLDF